MHYAKDCQDELLSVHPGRITPTGALGTERMQVANAYSVNQGVKSRLLYQDAALRDRPTRAHLDTLAEQGARIRVAASLPGRSWVIDGKVALLPIPSPIPDHRGLAIVRQPTVVQWVIATFEQLWSEAIPIDEVIGGTQGDPEVDRTRSAILRLLAEGEKDEAISRRLAISVRTTRRHIAEYMTQVGASSRFQAGVIAAKTGHLEIG
jgi:DNA-binding CsgD family transcriptional regulator